MPYVSDPAIEWDVFVSYAHVDDLEGWVDRFDKQLTVRLDQLAGRVGEIRIWRDRNLDESQFFDDVILNRLRRSAVFLALCSNGYLRSEYCAKELDAYRRQFGESALRVGERSRILRVRLDNLPHEELPDAAGRIGTFDFFRAEGAEDVGTRLDTASTEFRTGVDHLAKVLFKVLKELRQPPPPPPEPTGVDVFLAEVCDTQRALRSRVTADLEARAVTLVKPIPPPWGAVDHERAVRSAVADCRLAVHLFDTWGGRAVEDRPETTYSREQLRVVRETDIPQLVWIPPGLSLAETPSESADATQLDFLHRLETDRRPEDKYRLVRCPKNELVTAIERMVEELRPPPPPPSPDSWPEVLLDTHVKDQLLAHDVCKALLEKHVQPYLNPEADDPRRNISLFAERLKHAQGLIILFGQASEEWVRARLGEAVKLAITANCNLKTCGILLAPPDRGQDRASFEYPLFKPLVLDNRQGLNPVTLEPILHGLGVA